MSVHLIREINLLKARIGELAEDVQRSLQDAVTALESSDELLARRTMDRDREIDELEVSIEEEALKVLALHQPVAADLRFIVSIMKINNDLERIGDLAVNVAERVLYLASYPCPSLSFDFGKMANLVQEMLSKCMQAFVEMDASLARAVRSMDDDVDAMNRVMYEGVEWGITNHPEESKSYLHAFSVSRHLERIGDLATNIAEDVIYLAEGEIVRHQTEDYTKDNR